MKLSVLLATALLAASAPTLSAAQKFIPLGHSSLEETSELPKFGTPSADFNLQTDIYETNNYMHKKELRDWNTEMRRFDNHSESNPSNKFIDY